MLKSIAVVIGSYLVSVVLVLATDPLLSRIFASDFVKGRVPSDAALIARTALFVVVSILCAWLCARFAPGRAARHVLWFFIVGEVMGVGAIIPNWSKGWPHWYWLSWLLTWPMSCWIGLRLPGAGLIRFPPEFPLAGSISGGYCGFHRCVLSHIMFVKRQLQSALSAVCVSEWWADPREEIRP